MPVIGFLYGVVGYGAFLASFLYAIGFVGNLLVPKSIDSGLSGPLGEAMLVKAALLGLFAIQRSVMARPASGLSSAARRGIHAGAIQCKRLVQVRAPSLMLGFLIAFWATPHMTTGHLLFSIAMTAYIFTGIYFEEHDLANSHGEAFEQYRRDVPMIIPLPGRKDSRDRTP